MMDELENGMTTLWSVYCPKYGIKFSHIDYFSGHKHIIIK